MDENKPVRDLIQIASLGNTPSKYLVVGESHYFNSEELTDFSDNIIINDWYQLSIKEFCDKYGISDEHRHWFDTQWLFEHCHERYSNGNSTDRSKVVFWIVGRALADDQKHIPTRQEIAAQMANYDYMNYFQRPELKKGKSIGLEEINCIVAWDNFQNVVIPAIESNEYAKAFILSRKVYCEIEDKIRDLDIYDRIIDLSHPNYRKMWGYKSDNDYRRVVREVSNGIS